MTPRIPFPFTPEDEARVVQCLREVLVYPDDLYHHDCQEDL